MLFKISNQKVDQNSCFPENSLTFMKSRIPSLDSEEDNKRSGVSSKWTPCLISILILMMVLSLTMSALFYMNAFTMSSRKVVEVGVCHYKHKTGSCMTLGYCCDGSYAIGKGVCAGTQFCCMGAITKCNGNILNTMNILL